MLKIYIKMIARTSFPDGAVDKTLPARAGDVGLISGPGNSTCSWAAKSPCHDWARALVCAPRQERPPRWEPHTPQPRGAPTHRNQRRPAKAAKTTRSQREDELELAKFSNFMSPVMTAC